MRVPGTVVQVSTGAELNVRLLHWTDWYVVLFVTGVPIVSLYINREDYGAVIILVRSKGVLI
jgi:hypothetical protein